MADEPDMRPACLRDLMQRRPFEDYVDQPDTAERKRLAVQAIPFALPKKNPPNLGIDGVRAHF